MRNNAPDRPSDAARLLAGVDVVPATDAGLRRALALCTDRPRRWAYVGPDPEWGERVREALTGAGTGTNAGADARERAEIVPPSLNDVALGVRGRYLELLGEASTHEPPERWLASRLAEKEPFTTRCLRDLCLIESLLRIAREHPAAVLVVGDDVVFQTLRPEARSPLAEGARATLTWLRALAGRAVFTVREGRRVLIARRALGHHVANIAQHSSKHATMLMTWVDERSFDGGQFRDAYFGELSRELADLPQPSFTVGWLLPTVDFSTTISKMAQSPNDGLVAIHALVTLGDVVAAALSTLGRPYAPRVPDYQGIDLSPIVRADGLADLKSNRAAFNALVAKVPCRLAEMDISLSRVIYPFEGFAWEKLFLRAVASTQPGAETVAYQHSTAPSLSLAYYLSPAELERTPIASRIKVVGERSRLLLGEVYGSRVEVLGALRYTDLPAPSPRDASKRPNVLLTPSIDLKETVEFLDTAAEALSGLDADVVLKCHPMLPYEQVAPHLARPFLGGAFQLSTARPAALVAEADIVIATSTTLAIEALAAGAQVIITTLRYSLVLSPLVDTPDAAGWAYGAEELRAQVGEALKRRGADAGDDSRAAAAACVVAETFTPADAERIERFLG